ncbi:carboxypeptidase-like regulatory domain-containing protein [Tenacibaculum sp. SG-28]|uniref:carboxypeptidase-like regulatory domain-containing protein n=1 Tax=Tenacibaculum sp. SG-28 TaxID=754426 RepID=UPI000CF4A243|nr:carboxypeptidase-like regulatory domain-containing protein [Tenacibaculum sp. SG-28]PQJ20675.1 hypothetical protein BSU00_10255 [Tenacibaculum sp. SG-28]
MKSFITTLFFIITLLPVHAQYEITIEAYVLDETTKVPIPYVNVGFLGKGIGTVTNEKGFFTLKYDEDKVWEGEILQFSHLGYESLKIKAKDLFRALDTTNKLYLSSKEIELNEVSLTSSVTKDKNVGSLVPDPKTIGYWKGDMALGGEIASRIKIYEKNSKLKDLRIRILENVSDSIKLRINLYEFNKGYPRKNILNSEIYHTVSIKEGIEKIDLWPYNIIVNDDIIVSIELVEVYGDTLGFVIGGNSGKGPTFTKYISQDKWVKIPNVFMNFSMLTSYPDKKQKKFVKRDTPSRLLLLWDTSLSMSSKDNKEREFELLEEYFKWVNNADIDVIAFNSIITNHKSFTLNRGKSSTIVSYLRSLKYDGATSYSLLPKDLDSKYDAALLFSDGYATLSHPELDTSIPIFCINSNLDSDSVFLQELAFLSEGYFVNLSNTPVKAGLNFMTQNIEDTQVYNSSSTSGNIYGKVYDFNGPVYNASIRIKNTFVEVLSKEDGSYSIPAKYNDTLQVTRLGMKSKEMLVAAKKT